MDFPGLPLDNAPPLPLDYVVYNHVVILTCSVTK